MLPSRPTALLLLLFACSRTGVVAPGGDATPADAGTADVGAADAGTTNMWVYANNCRALFDYFLVQETPDECLIAAFGDRFFPGEGETQVELADVTRGPAPCPPPNEFVEGYPEARTEVEVEVTRNGDELRAALVGSFPDGSTFAVDFVSADVRDCCNCFGRAWPVPP